jgi:hypothetical protein
VLNIITWCTVILLIGLTAVWLGSALLGSLFG